MKKFISLVLTVVMLMSVMITGVAATASAAEKATVNGKEYAVGDTFTYTYSVTVNSAMENFQVYLKYDKTCLENLNASDVSGLKNYDKMFPNVYNKGMFMASIGADDGDAPNTEGVFVNGTSPFDLYDFKTSKVLFELKFKVLKAGTYTLNPFWEVISGVKESGESYDIVKYGEFFEEIKENVVLSESTIPPTPEKAIVNGTEYNVGDVIAMDIVLTFDKKLEDFQGEIEYTHSMLEAQSIEVFQKQGSIMAGLENEVGNVYYSGSSFSNPYDCTKTDTVLVTAKFKVTATGNGTIDNFIVRIDDVNSQIVVLDNEARQNITIKTPVRLVSGQPSTSSSATTSSSSETSSSSSSQPTPGGYAVINGVKFNVGDEVSFDILITCPKKFINFQGYVDYTHELLDPQSVVFHQNKGTVMDVLHTDNDHVGLTGISVTDPYDCTATDTKFITVKFKVTKAGTGTIEHVMVKMEDEDSNVIISNGQHVQEITIKTVVSGSTVTSSSSSSSSQPSSSSSQPPLPGDKTTFNGMDVKVGDKVRLAYYIQTDKLCEDFESVYYYGNKTLGTTQGIQLVGVKYTLDRGVMCNTGLDGEIRFNGTSPMTPYDFTKKQILCEAVFEIKDKGYDYFATYNMVNLTGVDAYFYVTDGVVEKEFVWEKVEEVITPPQSSSSSSEPSSSSSEPSSSSSEPSSSSSQPKTFTITNNLSHVVSSNKATTIKEGEMFNTILTPEDGYKITAVLATVGGENVEVFTFGDTYAINTKATGNITIMATATKDTSTGTTGTTPEPEKYSVLANLVNAKSSNSATTVDKGANYVTVVYPDAGYEISTITALNGADDIRPVKNADGSYTITTVVNGDIIITAIATKQDTSTGTTASQPPQPKTFNITNQLSNVTSSNNATTIKEGSMYSAILSPVDGYEITGVVVTVGTQTVQPTKSGDNYIISAEAKGDITVTATATKKTTSSSETSSSETKPEPTSKEIPPVTKPGDIIEINKIALSTAKLTVKEGERVNIVASIWPGYTTEKTVTWSVTNSRIGVVSQSKNTTTGLYDNDGKLYCTETATFTAKASGQTVIKAVSNTGLVAKCVVNVKSVATSIKVDKTSVTLNNGKSTTVKATVGPASIASDYKKVSWTSSNKKVATVSSTGKITAKGKGTCTVTATSNDNKSLKATVKVTVKQPVTSVKFNKSSVTIAKKGKTATVKATVSPSNANNKKLAIKSKNTKIVKVSKSTVNSGAAIKIKAVKKGSTYVMATAKDGSKKSAKVKVTVKK